MLTHPPGYIPSLREARAGIQAGTEAEDMEECCLLVYFLIQHRTTIWGGTALGEMDPLTSIIKKRRCVLLTG